MIFKMNDATEILELMHAGVAHDKNPPGRGSGRYAFGTGKRPNQRSSKKAQRAAKKAAEARAKAREIAKKAEEERKQHEADKERVVREGTASEVLKYRNELSDAELGKIVKRIEWYGKLEDASKKDVQDGWKKVDSVMQKVKMISDWTNTAVTAKNNFDKLVAMFVTDEEQKKKK